MNVDRTLFLIPRILVIMFAAFLSLFALDVFSEGGGLWQTIVAFIIHLIPALIALIVLAIAWRWEFAGDVLLIVLACWYAIMARDHLSWILVISGPLVTTGLLFFASSVYRARHRKRISIAR